LAKNTIDLQKAAEKCGLCVQGNTPNKYPKIVKYSDGCGSLSLVEKSTAFGILVQDYIFGRECRAIVVEMGREVVGLTPLQ
jgi:hypothetical protein